MLINPYTIFSDSSGDFLKGWAKGDTFLPKWCRFFFIFGKMYLFFHVSLNSESELNKQYGPFSVFQYILIRIVKENVIAFFF